MAVCQHFHTTESLSDSLNASALPERNDQKLTCVELFAGCGGLAAGLQLAGFEHSCMVESNPVACETLRRNFRQSRSGSHPLVLEQDVRTIQWGDSGEVALLAGGPPCQPFSFGGLAEGKRDSRDMWPEAVRAVRELRPRAFLFENVRGLLRPSFAEYLDGIVNRLAYAGGQRGHKAPLYNVAVVLVDAADYGVSQRRHRVFIGGVRADCGTLRPFPAPTHSFRRLVWEKWVSGTYWHRHAISSPESHTPTRIEQSILRKLRDTGLEPQEGAWGTCRDAFAGLGEPMHGSNPLRHELRRGARQYPGHAGSPVDSPAKALKAGAHGVPGGENVLVDSDHSVRYFTVREAARLQGLPDSFIPSGSWSEAMRQLGNAVPVQLAEVAGRWIRSCID
ncbi:DNA cytosine methyltransferase [Paraburkholderia lycopersici]|uniref:DNA (cytosine-5-)-methyltransferase n=1 Tax=Paraburkholderia lycopersici TaxID=416944 RepID=A0A1G6M3N2_9BURK|nr:DNA (cytosine-5-)-methyltransferase [Paraburkholderia lycopersici]SDC49595.1 DNA (cytosine-5)-methyltransferase 1 [Paraburkholderia lycopersici]